MSKHRLPLRNADDRKRVFAWLDRAPLGEGWRVEFLPPIRSTDQNRRLWAFLDDVAAQKSWEGKKRSSEAWKDLFTAALKTQEIVRGLEGGIVALGARTSEMSPEEMSDLLALIEAWGAQNGIVFTDQESPSSPGGGSALEAAEGAPPSARETESKE